jgi:hypothetical protein
MSIAYILYLFVVFLVITLLLGLPLFPFCKVWSRVKNYHPDLWLSKGPFGVMDFMSGTGAIRNFITFLDEAAHDEGLKAKDPTLVKWARFSHELIKMLPKSFLGQIGVAVLFVYFMWCLTSGVMGAIGGLLLPAAPV